MSPASITAPPADKIVGPVPQGDPAAVGPPGDGTSGVPTGPATTPTEITTIVALALADRLEAAAGFRVRPHYVNHHVGYSTEWVEVRARDIEPLLRREAQA